VLLPLRLKASEILLFHLNGSTTAVRAFAASFTLSATPSTSSPQHFLTCLRIFPVEWASLVSRNRRIFVRQPRAVHLNVCATRPSITLISGTGSKKAYMGETQSFLAFSIVVDYLTSVKDASITHQACLQVLSDHHWQHWLCQRARFLAPSAHLLGWDWLHGCCPWWWLCHWTRCRW